MKREECADYEDVSSQLAAEMHRVDPRILTLGEIKAFLANIANYTRMHDDSLAHNEVRMVDYDDPNVADLKQHVFFSEFSKDVGYFACATSNAPACVVPKEDSPRTGERVANIILQEGEYSRCTSLTLPGFDGIAGRTDANFSRCTSTAGNAYRTALHEAGHLLGIRGGTVDKAVWIEQMSGHPTVPGSVMNYDRVELYVLGHLGNRQIASEFDSYPHPLDIMALLALYQND